MEKYPFWWFLSSFWAVFFFITCVLIMNFYTWAACRACWKVNQGRTCKERCKKTFAWENRYEDNRDYQDEEMPSDWVLYHFMYDLNILKPLACFHYVVYFYKRVLFCVFIIRYMNDAFTMLTLLLLLNLFSFLWICLVWPYKSTINNRINIWMEFCMIVLSILMFPLAYKWTPFKKAKMYA